MSLKEDVITTVCQTCNENKLCSFSEIKDWKAYGETGEKWYYCDDCKEAVLRDRRAVWAEDWINCGGDIGELAQIRKEIRKFTTEHLTGKRDELCNLVISSASARLFGPEAKPTDTLYPEEEGVEHEVQNIIQFLDNLTDEMGRYWIMAHLIVEELRERGMEYSGTGINRHE